jgi:hypothetical protein
MGKWWRSSTGAVPLGLKICEVEQNFTLAQATGIGSSRREWRASIPVWLTDTPNHATLCKVRADYNIRYDIQNIQNEYSAFKLQGRAITRRRRVDAQRHVP